MRKLFLVLPDIRSAQNVGAMFRTADAFGVSHIFIIGYTPAPIDRFGRARSDIAKSALGAEKTIPWSQHESLMEVIEQLKKQNVKVVAIEQSPRSIDYRTLPTDTSVAIVMGNEVEGLSEDILNHVDMIAEIPMKGMKESLNVSVACGIILSRLS